MINFEKVNIFKIEKEMKNEISQGKDLADDRPFTFKITKRRSPWTPEVSFLIIFFLGRRSYNGLSK
jgi:hypothetical protein